MYTHFSSTFPPFLHDPNRRDGGVGWCPGHGNQECDEPGCGRHDEGLKINDHHHRENGMMTLSLPVVDIVRCVGLRGEGRREGGAANWWAAGLCRLQRVIYVGNKTKKEEAKMRRGACDQQICVLRLYTLLL